MATNHETWHNGISPFKIKPIYIPIMVQITGSKNAVVSRTDFFQVYPCKWCGKEFRSTGGRDMHVQAEHQGTRYDCNVCFKQFKRKGSLGRHMLGVHTPGQVQ